MKEKTEISWKRKNSPNTMIEIDFKNHQETIKLWGMADETEGGKYNFSWVAKYIGVHSVLVYI